MTRQQAAPFFVQGCRVSYRAPWPPAGRLRHDDKIGRITAKPTSYRVVWLFAKFEAKAKSFHNGLICAFDGCVHFATHTPCVESA
jgi:hypothetical protein